MNHLKSATQKIVHKKRVTFKEKRKFPPKKTFAHHLHTQTDQFFYPPIQNRFVCVSFKNDFRFPERSLPFAPICYRLWSFNFRRRGLRTSFIYATLPIVPPFFSKQLLFIVALGQAEKVDDWLTAIRPSSIDWKFYLSFFLSWGNVVKFGWIWLKF